MSFQIIAAPAGFKSRPRVHPISQIVVHESVTNSLDSTLAVLHRRGLGTHLAIDPDGHVVRLAADDEVLAHAGALNSRSVAVEVVNPYYPVAGRVPKPWQRAITAKWPHKGWYVVPTEAQLDALWSTLCRLFVDLAMPPQWAGLRPGGRFAMGLFPGANALPGVHAHCYTAHADGAFPVLYCYLRSVGADHGEAYRDALALAAGAGSAVTLPPGGLYA